MVIFWSVEGGFFCAVLIWDFLSPDIEIIDYVCKVDPDLLWLLPLGGIVVFYFFGLTPALYFKLVTRFCLLLFKFIFDLISFLNCLSFLSSSLRLSSEEVMDIFDFSPCTFSNDPSEIVDTELILLRSEALSFFFPLLVDLLFGCLLVSGRA